MSSVPASTEMETDSTQSYSLRPSSDVIKYENATTNRHATCSKGFIIAIEFTKGSIRGVSCKIKPGLMIDVALDVSSPKCPEQSILTGICFPNSCPSTYAECKKLQPQFTLTRCKVIRETIYTKYVTYSIIDFESLSDKVVVSLEIVRERKNVIIFRYTTCLLIKR
ncbi:Uncharacterised protein g11421 [Pycnogonum litorale]